MELSAFCLSAQPSEHFLPGSNFTLNEFSQVTWTNPLRGVEAAFSFFNLSFSSSGL